MSTNVFLLALVNINGLPKLSLGMPNTHSLFMILISLFISSTVNTFRIALKAVAKQYKWLIANKLLTNKTSGNLQLTIYQNTCKLQQ